MARGKVVEIRMKNVHTKRNGRGKKRGSFSLKI